MSSRTDFVSPNTALTPVGTAETRAHALRAIFGPHAARAAVRFAMEAHEMGEDDAALIWMQTASRLVDDDDFSSTPLLH